MSAERMAWRPLRWLISRRRASVLSSRASSRRRIQTQPQAVAPYRHNRHTKK